MNLKELRDKLAGIKAKMQPLAAMKSLSDEQDQELQALLADYDQVDRQIKAAERLTAGNPDATPEGTVVATVDDRLTSVEASMKALREALEGQVAGPAGGVKTVNQKRVTQLGFSDEEGAAFYHYLKTGDIEAVKAVKASNVNPLNETDDAQGAVNVPQQLYDRIVEKRSEASIARQAGALIINSTAKSVDVVVENGASTYFAIAANDEAAVDEDDPTFTKVNIPIYDFTKLTKVSLDLLADRGTNLEQYLQSTVARAASLTENKYFMVGTGSGQPQGAYVGGTKGVDLAASAAIAVGEVSSLLYKLPSAYMEGAVWALKNATVGSIRQLGTSTFRWYAPTPFGTPGGNPGAGVGGDLEGKPVFISDEIAGIASGAKSMLIGNFALYAIAQREGMTVTRLNELYAANRQVGFLWYFRLGGAVLQAEAFQYAKHNTT